ncbi:MAG: hypothetical protein EOP07_07420 [Proteobacteria bacterium]|nr:MAG: hypothetical protein EOP07_07420 [Pseudomonadota bacterium]
MWRKFVSAIIATLALSLAPHLFAIDEVKPLFTVNVPMTRYGINWQITQTRLLVKNIGYVKELTLVYDIDGKEKRASATYYGPADNGYEIWEAYSNIPQGTASYRIDYKVEGQSFVDDNEGTLYPLIEGPLFYANQNVSQILSGREFYYDYAGFTAAVRSDLGSSKNVTLHYTFDDFKTVKELRMNFQIQYLYGYGLIDSPSHNTEIFHASLGNIPDSVALIQYYLSYEVDGKTYYDNNFGNNYSMPRAKTSKVETAR